MASIKPFKGLFKPKLGSSGFVDVKYLFKVLAALFSGFELDCDASMEISSPAPGHILLKSRNGVVSSNPFEVTDNGDDTYSIASGFVYTSSWTGDPDSQFRHVPEVNGIPLDASSAPFIDGTSGAGNIVMKATFDMLTGAAKGQPWPITWQSTEPADTDIIRGTSASGGVDGVYYLAIWTDADSQIVKGDMSLDMLYNRLHFND